MNRKKKSETGAYISFIVLVIIILIAVFKVSGANSLYNGTKNSDTDEASETAEITDRNGFDKNTNITYDVFDIQCSIPQYFEYADEGHFTSDEEPVEMYIWGFTPDSTYGYDLTTNDGLKSFSDIELNTYATQSNKEVYDVQSEEDIIINGTTARMYSLNLYKGTSINTTRLISTGYEVTWYDSDSGKVYIFLMMEDKDSDYEYYEDFMDIVESAKIK